MKARGRIKFRLYVARDTENAAKAIANLTEFCQAHLPGRFEIDLVDVFEEPKRAMADGVFLTPMLIKLSPRPVCRIVGTLSLNGPLLRIVGPKALAAA